MKKTILRLRGLVPRSLVRRLGLCEHRRAALTHWTKDGRAMTTLHCPECGMHKERRFKVDTRVYGGC